MIKRRKYHHPIHPILVHFPIAFLLGATFLHVLYVAADMANVWNMAIWMIGFGLVTGVATLIAGVRDFFRFIIKMERDDTILTVIWHIAFVAIALFLYLMIFVYSLHSAEQDINPFYFLTLSLLGGGTLTVGGFFGGLLVYKYGVGQPAD